MRFKNRRTVYILLAAAIAVLAWGLFDLFGPRRSDLREFDPDTVARIETDMWRSYYDQERVIMFFQLTGLLRHQYRAPFLRSALMGVYGAKAAFVFKDGKQRSDYEQALPDLVRYYSAIRRMSVTDFDVDQAARLELEWWIIHREREKYGREALDRSLAELQAAIYRQPVDRFMEHGRLRAEAMVLRDSKTESGGVSEADWSAIYELLRRSWGGLWTELHRNS